MILLAWMEVGNEVHLHFREYSAFDLGHLQHALEAGRSGVSNSLGLRRETNAGTDAGAGETKGGPARRERGIDQDDLLSDPEIRRQVEAEVQKQVEGWVRTKVPALGGRTPLQAVADPDGREMVEALLQGWERQNEVPGSASIVRPEIT
jgi:hypothetical protein